MKKENSPNIAKNTLFLYFRMICISLVTLYTSRVVLRVLGATDYGIYQTVGGIVGMLSFVNGALSTGSSRFLTFELGRGDICKLKTMFSSLLSAHIILAILVVIIGEPVGLWFINTKLNIPVRQIVVAKVIYQFSLITAFMNITQVPYSSVIIAHENMRIYAYVSLLEAMLKLLVAFAITISPINKLIFYAAMLCLSQLCIRVVYRSYCRKKYIESRFTRNAFDSETLKEVFGFSGWSLFASVSTALIRNGTIILLTTFFSPVLAASRSIVDQVNNTLSQFISNFRTASNPQIVKRYAVKDYVGSKRLLLKSTYLSYYLMLFISLPVILLAEPLIKLWLGQIPEYVVPFLQWTMIQSLFAVFDSSFYVPLYAKGRLKENALIAPTIDVLCLAAVYIGFLNGHSPLIICYIYVAMTLIQGLIEKPILVCYIVGYKYKEIFYVYMRCFFVTLISTPLPCYLVRKVDTSRIANFLLICVVSSISIGLASWFVGMSSADKRMIINYLKTKIHWKQLLKRKGE